MGYYRHPAALFMPGQSLGPADPVGFSHVRLLCPFEGANGATTTTDLSTYGHAVSMLGTSCTISTANPFAGGSSLSLGSASARIHVGGTSDFSFLHNAAGTVEFDYLFPGFGSTITLLDNSAGTQNNTGIWVECFTNRSVNVQVYNGGGAGTAIVNGSFPAGSIANDTTNYQNFVLQFDYSLGSGNVELFVGGVSKGTLNKTGNTPAAGAASFALAVGNRNNGSANPSGGLMDRLRVTDIRRYTSGNFTPPTGPHPTH